MNLERKGTVDEEEEEDKEESIAVKNWQSVWRGGGGGSRGVEGGGRPSEVRKERARGARRGVLRDDLHCRVSAVADLLAYDGSGGGQGGGGGGGANRRSPRVNDEGDSAQRGRKRVEIPEAAASARERPRVSDEGDLHLHERGQGCMKKRSLTR